MRKRLWLIAASILLIVVTAARAGTDTLHINGTGEYPVSQYLYIYKSTKPVEPHYVFDSIERVGLAKLHPKKIFNAGITRDYYWFVFTIKNDLSKDISLFFALNNPGINVARFYRKDKSGIQFIGEAGDHVSFNNRPLKYYDIVFPFQVEKNGMVELAIMLDNSGDNIDCMPELYDINIFTYKERRYYIVISMITGIMLTAFLLNMFLAVTFRDRLHAVYGLYIISILFEMFILQGIDVQYIYPGKPALSDIFKYLCPAVTLTLMAVVMQSFLNQQKSNTRMKIWVDILKYFIVILIPVFIVIYFFIPTHRTVHGIYQQIFALALALQLLMFFLSALEKVIQGFKPAWFYLAAIVYLCYGAIQYVITILGGDTKEMIERQPNDLQIGIVTETIIVFFGII